MTHSLNWNTRTAAKLLFLTGIFSYVEIAQLLHCSTEAVIETLRTPLLAPSTPTRAIPDRRDSDTTFDAAPAGRQDAPIAPLDDAQAVQPVKRPVQPPRGSQYRKKRVVPSGDIRRAEIKQLLAEGMKPGEIAKQLKVSKQNISYYIRTM